MYGWRIAALVAGAVTLATFVAIVWTDRRFWSLAGIRAFAAERPLTFARVCVARLILSAFSAAALWIGLRGPL
jgi:hypothetical protein